MSSRAERGQLLLHVWPGSWGLPSIDPQCLAAILYLQQAFPGDFHIQECTDPDLSPSGQLPFLTTDSEMEVIATFPAIVKHVSSLRRHSSHTSKVYDSLSAGLKGAERASEIAWIAHAESALGNLVANMHFAMHANWNGLTHPTLAAMFAVPQRYYVPQRMRDACRPKLESAGLWSLPGVETENKSPFQRDKTPKRGVEGAKEKFVRSFERDRVLEKARFVLDKYDRLLGGKSYFFADSPTTLDIVVASHTLLLLLPAFPDPLVQDLIKDSYPLLAAHAHRVYSVYQDATSPPSILPPSRPTLSALLPSVRLLTSGNGTNKRGGKRPKEEGRKEDDVRFDWLRWAWFALSLGAAAVYWSRYGIRIRLVDAGELEGEEGEVYEDEEEGDEEDEDEPVEEDME